MVYNITKLIDKWGMSELLMGIDDMKHIVSLVTLAEKTDDKLDQMDDDGELDDYRLEHLLLPTVKYLYCAIYIGDEYHVLLNSPEAFDGAKKLCNVNHDIDLDAITFTLINGLNNFVGSVSSPNAEHAVCELAINIYLSVYGKRV
jgi:hypothetical protein